VATNRQQSSTELSTAEALQSWREAEQNLALAKSGRAAAEAAAQAAAQAALAAEATAEAARAAMRSAQLAEESATRTAAAAQAVVAASGADVSRAQDDLAWATAGEADAHQSYREAEARARDRTGEA
jgi:hypothetical protein